MPDYPSQATRSIATPICFVASVTLPLLLARATVPDSVFLNQILAVAGWGAVLLLVAEHDSRMRVLSSFTCVFWAVVVLLVLVWLFGRPEGRQGLDAQLLTAAVAVAVLLKGAWTGSSRLPKAFASAWLLVGLTGVAISLVQYFVPSVADGWLVAVSGSPGRAVGNMRQPNHLATALLCAMVMAAWLWRANHLPARWGCVALVAMVLGVALSASRTGALSLGVLVVWALADKGLPRSARWSLAATPIWYFVFWAALAEYASWQHTHFYAADRLQSSSDISSSRFAIWRNAWELVMQNPWTGVGWGHFNFAWTFTPFPDRPIAFFDHTHNLPLQLAVELGLPATAALLGLLAWALWRARGAWQAGAAPDHPARAALVMLVVLGVHSLLEYPLWYAYFLLPAAWALGVFLGSAPGRAASSRAAGVPTRAAAVAARIEASVLRLIGLAMIVGAAYAVWDHRRIEAIFSPPPGAEPLGVRIAEGQKSRLFGHHADYAAVTNEPKDQTLETFRRPLHQLVDVRLLIAYIEALRANGRDAEALYAAQRLREFRRDDAQAYFKDCTPDNPTPPFQCNTTLVPLTWRDLEP